MVRPVKNRFWAALDYHNYGLADNPSMNGDHVAKGIAEWASRSHVEMKTNILHSFDPI